MINLHERGFEGPVPKINVSHIIENRYSWPGKKPFSIGVLCIKEEGKSLTDKRCTLNSKSTYDNSTLYNWYKMDFRASSKTIESPGTPKREC